MALSPDFRGRVEGLRERARDRDLDAVVLTRDGSTTYLSGVAHPWRSAVVVPVRDHVTLVTSEYDAERVRSDTWIDDVRSWSKGAAPKSFVAVVREVLEGVGGTDAIGVELDTADSPGVLSALEYRNLDRGLSGDLENFVDQVNEEMLVKGPAEIARLRRAAEIADAGVEAAFDAIEPGVPETAVAGEAERAMRAAGDEFTWSVTGTEVGSGHRQSYQDGLTAMTSRKLIQRGDAVTVDVHPTYDGYLGDLCLPAVVGEPSGKQRELASAWEHVATAVLDALGPGVRVATVAERARSAAAETDAEEWFFESYQGHGLGTTARLPPLVSASSERTLEPGTVLVALVYLGRPGVGGFRLEVPVLITGDGSERLAKSPIEPRVIDG